MRKICPKFCKKSIEIWYFDRWDFSDNFWALHDIEFKKKDEVCLDEDKNGKKNKIKI